eukprot:symbB.v1.2.020497.t1/scaffold1687.1/size105823/3
MSQVPCPEVIPPMVEIAPDRRGGSKKRKVEAENEINEKPKKATRSLSAFFTKTNAEHQEDGIVTEEAETLPGTLE